MTKITFKDLPDTSTPLNANNLNTLQDNVENAIDTVAGDIPTIDSSVSTSSTNPVENQAITIYVDNEIQDAKDYTDAEVGKLQITGNGTIVPQELTNGTCAYFKVGKLVVLTIADLYGNSSQITGDGTVLISGLPKAKAAKVFILQSYSTFEQVRVRVTVSGQVCLHYSTLPATSSGKQFYAVFVYETTD